MWLAGYTGLSPSVGGAQHARMNQLGVSDYKLQQCPGRWKSEAVFERYVKLSANYKALLELSLARP